MVRYGHYRKAELAKFARDRSLNVRSSGVNAKRPLKQDLVYALRAADDNLNFRFLDLPPELRNMVYRELLVIEGRPSPGSSPKCHPQVLRTSMEVNQEASSILYGHNTIGITVQPGRIYAHGFRCGTYLSDTPANTQQPQKREIKDLVRPDFLRRAQFIRADSINLARSRRRHVKLPNCGTLHNILFSICSFLQYSRALRSFTVDLTFMVDFYVQNQQLDTLADQLHTAVYPLRILDAGVSIILSGTELLGLQLPLQSNAIAARLAQSIVARPGFSVFRQLHATTRAFLSAVGPTLRNQLERQIRGGLWGGSFNACNKHRHGTHASVWEGIFKTALMSED